jgi:hypothetical protein
MNIKHIFLILAISSSAPARAHMDPAKGSTAKNAGQGQSQVYCVKYENETGSRLARQLCMTKKQWAQEGVNVDELKRK